VKYARCCWQLACALSVLPLGVAQAEDGPEPRERPSRPESSAMPHARRERMHEQIDRLRAAVEQRRHVGKLKAEIEHELGQETPNRELLQKKLEELAESRAERRRTRQLSLAHELGPSAEKPEVRGELERHARAVARLERIKFLAATERSGDSRKQLLERVARLSELEERRYHQRVRALLQPAPGPADSAKAPSSSRSAGPP